MFRRKPKTRVEVARENIIKFQKQAEDTRKDVVKQLNRTAKHLRHDVEELLEGDKRASQLAKELEHVAQDIEKKAEKRIEGVSEVATSNVWLTIGIAFGIGLLFGLLFKVLKR